MVKVDQNLILDMYKKVINEIHGHTHQYFTLYRLDHIYFFMDGYAMPMYTLTDAEMYVKGNEWAYFASIYPNLTKVHSWDCLMRYYNKTEEDAIKCFEKHLIKFVKENYNIDIASYNVRKKESIKTFENGSNEIDREYVLEKCKPLFDVLDHCKGRPAMLVRHTSMTLLYQFIVGYIAGLEACYGVSVPFDSAFDEFVNAKFNDGVVCHWMKKILFYSISEEEAYDSFSKLLDEFRASSK